MRKVLMALTASLAGCAAHSTVPEIACQLGPEPLLDEAPMVAIAGGFAHPPSGRGFVAGPRGGIDAIDLHSGQFERRIDGVVEPLAIGPAHLAAVREGEDGLRIVVLSLATACDDPLIVSDPISGLFPRRRIFDARRAGPDALLVGWRSCESTAGLRAARCDDGWSVVDLRTGRRSVAEEPVPMPSSSSPDFYPWSDGLRAPRPVNGGEASLGLVDGALVFRRPPDEALILADPAPPFGYASVLVTSDGGHVSVSLTNHEATSEHPAGSEGTTRVLSMDTGEVVVEIPTWHASPVAVVAGRVLVERVGEDPPEDILPEEGRVPRVLDAYEIGTSRRVWTYQLRGTPAWPPPM